MPAALIFDLDGTLADTMPAHYEAWRGTLRQFDLAMSEDRFYELGGWPTLRIVELLARETGRKLDAAAIARHKEEAFLAAIDRIQPIEPVVRVVQEHRGRMPLAVATGAVQLVGERILRQIAMLDQFDALVYADDVAHHKPAPDIFLRAAELLGVPAAECLVYEDTDPGLEAARRAGMESRDVRTFYRPRRVT